MFEAVLRVAPRTNAMYLLSIGIPLLEDLSLRDRVQTDVQNQVWWKNYTAVTTRRLERYPRLYNARADRTGHTSLGL